MIATADRIGVRAERTDGLGSHATVRITHGGHQPRLGAPPAIDAESACGLASARIAHERTSPDASLERVSSSDSAAGSRARNSAHVARQRISSSADFVHRTIGAMSPRAVDRPIDSSASPIVAAVRGVSVGDGEIAREHVARGGRLDLAERARGFGCDRRRRARHSTTMNRATES